MEVKAAASNPAGRVAKAAPIGQSINRLACNFNAVQLFSEVRGSE